MTEIVRRLTIDDAKRERAEALASTGMTENALRAAGREWALDAEQRGALARIDGLDWLMTGVSEPCCPCERPTCVLHDSHDEPHQPRERWWTR